MPSTGSNDEDLVEFEVAELVGAEQGHKYKQIPFNVLADFLNQYIDYLASNISKGKKDVILRLVLPTGRNPTRHVFIPFVEERSIIGGRSIVGFIGYLQTTRYPLTLDLIEMEISPIPIPRSRAILNPAHFIILEYEDSAYIIFERNNSAPSLTKFTEYICNAWGVIDRKNAAQWCPVKHMYIGKNQDSTLRQYKIVTSITISGGLKAAAALHSFRGMNIKDGILNLNARHFTIEFSGRGNKINLTIDDVIDIYRRIMELGGRGIVTRFTVRVKRHPMDRKSITINLLRDLLVLYSNVPLARDEEGRELGSLDTNEAFRSLVDLADEVKRILSGDDAAPPPPRKTKTLLDYLTTG